MTMTDARFQHCEVACSGALLASTHFILHSPDVVPLWLSVNWWDTEVQRPRGGQLGTTLPTPVQPGVPELRAGRRGSKPAGLLPGNLTVTEGLWAGLRRGRPALLWVTA